MRLDKFFSLHNIASRKESRRFLKQNQVFVNDKLVKSPNEKINFGDTVSFGEFTFTNEEYVYYLLNKPKEYVSATSDNVHSTVLELLDYNHYQTDLFPVGRLDIDTTGLLLITNDGDLAHKMLHPKRHVAKKYIVDLESNITDGEIRELEQGVLILDEYLTKPCKVNRLAENKIEMIIMEGKFHQIKKMMHTISNEVVELERVEFGNLILPEDLEPGDYLLLDREDILV